MTKQDLKKSKNKGGRPKQEGLDPAMNLSAFMDYLAQFYYKDASHGGSGFLNGQEVKDEADKRSMHRWLFEATPSSYIGFFRADLLLTSYGLKIEDFFYWCRDNGREPWYTKSAKKRARFRRDFEGI